MSKVYIDIETVPTQLVGPDEFRDQAKVPGNYKKPEVIEQYKTDNAEAEWRKTGLDGTQGEIICIGWAIEDAKPNAVFRMLGDSEADLLRSFWSDLEHGLDGRKATWVGHNITGFDLRFMWHRSVINQVAPAIDLRHNAKPWADGVIDTLYEWKGANIAGGSLDKICKAFGMEGKGNIDGSKVWDAIKEGRYDEVAEYCADDVAKTRAIHKRMNFTN